VSLLAAATGAAIAQPAPSAKAEEQQKLPAMVDVGGAELQTRDGVLLRAAYYPSLKGKAAVPVILLHMWKGDRKEYLYLAPYLQKRGHAVLVPDLRGHGDSTKQRVGNLERTLDALRLSPADFAGMVQFDMEALKAYLVKKNNDGELNIEKLCVVGAEMGASVAIDWARLDWSWPALGGRRQGQDVKALVLITPQWGFPGLTIRAALSDPSVLRELSILIIAGSDDARAVSEATRMHTVLARYHPEPLQTEVLEKKDLFFVKPETKLQGTKMLDIRELNVETTIGDFIEYRLVKKSFPWQDRR
jgi:pimeloyl-ACP methyl ester carboxylesterase